MRIRVLAVGTRMPTWVTTGVDDYQRRLPRDFSVEWIDIPPAKSQGEPVPKLMAKEAAAIKRQLKSGERLVVLDVAGRLLGTDAIAVNVAQWQQSGGSAAVVIGGPDGTDPSLLAQADLCWSLGRITMAHPLVRVVLAEQLYRVWSIIAQHPYHRS